MQLFRGTSPKCEICGRWRKVVVAGAEGYHKYVFHYECVRECLEKPKEHTLEQVETAIQIIRNYKRYKEEEKKHREEKQKRSDRIWGQAKEEYKKIYSLEEDRNSDFLPDSKED